MLSCALTEQCFSRARNAGGVKPGQCLAEPKSPNASLSIVSLGAWQALIQTRFKPQHARLMCESVSADQLTRPSQFGWVLHGRPEKWIVGEHRSP